MSASADSPPPLPPPPPPPRSPTTAACPVCGYDLATSGGKVLEVCPECGASIAATSAARSRERVLRLGLTCALASVPFIAIAEIASEWGLLDYHVGRDAASLEPSPPLTAGTALAGASLFLSACACLLAASGPPTALRRAGWWIVAVGAILALERYALANPDAGLGAWRPFGSAVSTWLYVGTKWLGSFGVAAAAWLLLRLLAHAARGVIMPRLAKGLSIFSWATLAALAAVPVIDAVLSSQKQAWTASYIASGQFMVEMAWQKTTLSGWHAFFGHWLPPARAAALIGIGVGAIAVHAGMRARAEEDRSERLDS